MESAELQLRGHLLKNAEQIGRFIRRRIPANLRSFLSHEDIRQDVWLAAYRKLPTHLLNDDQAVLRWLSVVARRKLSHAAARAYAKKRGGDLRRVIDDYQASSCVGFLARFADEARRTVSSEHAVLEGSRAVRTALATLPIEQLQAVCMRHFEGRSHQDIATRLGKSKAAVNSLLHRGMNQLRENLGDPSRYLSDVYQLAANANGIASSQTNSHQHDVRP